MFMKPDEFLANRLRIFAIVLDLSGAKFAQTSEGSFSAVTKPNWPSECAFGSSRRDRYNTVNTVFHTILKSHFLMISTLIC